MELKRQTITILMLLIFIDTYAQHVSAPQISTQDKTENRKRAKLKIATYKCIKSDSTYFYIENYNKNGQVISHYDSESSVTKYDYNSFGKKIRAYQIIDDKPDTLWEAQYKNDTLLFTVKWDVNSDYKEEIIYDNLEREANRYKRYRKYLRIDSTITIHSGRNRLEITYEKGKPVLKITEKKDLSSSTEDYFNFITPDSTVHYLTWTTHFDLKGNETMRVQQFRDEKTEYLTTHTNKGLEKTSTVKTNGKVNFEITNYYDEDSRLIKSIYKEHDYKTETDYFYNEINIESKSISTTFKKGQKPKTETFISTYEFYTD